MISSVVTVGTGPPSRLGEGCKFLYQGANATSDISTLAPPRGYVLKAKMKETGVIYAGLVQRLEAHGFKETEASITMKLKRGTFAVTFLFACLAALELEGLQLTEIVEL